MTEAEKWRTLAQALAVAVPVGTPIGFGLGWLNRGAGASMAAGAVIGLLITAGMVTFNVSLPLDVRRVARRGACRLPRSTSDR